MIKPIRPGRRVRVAREERGLIRAELALLVPCSRHTIFSIENGRRGCSGPMARAIEKALELDRYYLEADK